MDWTAGNVAKLTDDWAAGHSAGQIAATFQVSRNTIIGKVNRLKLPRPEFKLPVMADGHSRVYSVKRHTGKTIKLPKVKRSKPWEMEATEPSEEQAVHAVALRDREPHHCCWPIGGELAELICCGAQHIESYPYCAYHCRMAYRRAPNVSETERAERTARVMKVNRRQRIVAFSGAMKATA
jgi:GcrA cell cycle regulator